MKTLLFVTILGSSIFAITSSWVNANANEAIVVSYEYSSQAGLLP